MGRCQGLSPVYGRSGLRPSLVQGLRPRNAPLQNHPSPTVFTLPQHRVWRTESTPPMLSHPPNPCSFPAVPLQFPRSSPPKTCLTDRTSSYLRCAPTNMAAANRIPIQIARVASAMKRWSRQTLDVTMWLLQDHNPTVNCPLEMAQKIQRVFESSPRNDCRIVPHCIILLPIFM